MSFLSVTANLPNLAKRVYLNSIYRSGIRYLFKHPWQFGLSVLGIAMGVALVVSIDIANHSSAKAFDLSIDAVAGKATHQITGTSEGIPDSLYRHIRINAGFRNTAPVIETFARLPGESGRIFKLIGVDFFAERPFRDYLSDAGNSIDGELRSLMTENNSVALSEQSLNEIGKSIGDTFSVLINGNMKMLKVAGVIKSGDNNKTALENLLVTDIASAQELSGKDGTIDLIDLIIDSDDELGRIREILPPGYEIQKSGARSQTAEQMLDAFNINLQSLSLLALIVGLFLIYNTMTFSVVRRKTTIGTLRSLGVTSGEIYGMILSEALVMGIAGTVLGFIAALFLSNLLISYITQTINDLYYVVSVREIHVSPFIVFKGAALGIIATLISAFKPAREASEVHPRSALIRSEQESSILGRIPKMSFYGIALMLAGAIVLLIPSQNILLSYFGILPVITGFALMTPSVILLMEKILSPLFRYLFGVTGKIASRSVLQNISRTYVAIAALSLAVASTVGVGTMISSFRSTVIEWLTSRLNADIFISAPNLVSRRNDAVLPDELVERIRNVEGVDGINFYREIELFQNGKRIHLISSGVSKRGFEGFSFKEGDPAEVWKKFLAGEIIISEPFAFRNELEAGSVLSLRTDKGMKDFKIAGVYYDYASDQGLVAVYHETFRNYWDAKGVSGIAAYVSNSSSPEEVKKRIQSLETNDQQMLVRSHKYLRDSSVEIFDRTFLVAKVLQILSVIVAFIGILSSLMSLQLERSKELGILRATGMLPLELFKMVNLQTLMMGATAGLLALPLGNLLAVILVYIINKRSFGWTMQFNIEPLIMLEAIVLAVVGALLAGLYPGYRMSKTPPATALREE